MSNFEGDRQLIMALGLDHHLQKSAPNAIVHTSVFFIAEKLIIIFFVASQWCKKHNNFKQPFNVSVAAITT